MSISHPDSLFTAVEILSAKYPAYLSLLVARTDNEFDTALEGILEKIIDDIERDAALLSRLKEDGLTAVIAIAINGTIGLHATQQAHSNGHVDITIEAILAQPIRRRLGEAKIYNGPQYHEKGLEQLVNRYSTGREGSGFMIEYFRVSGIKELSEKIRAHMDHNRPCSQEGGTESHWMKWAFVTHHLHSSGELVRVVHLNCNLHPTT